MVPARARFLAAGDTALIVEFASSASLEASHRVLGLQERLRAAAPAGLVETVATFRSLAIHLDPDATSPARMEAAVVPLLEGLEAAKPEGRAWRLPVCYEQDFAPDLVEVGRRTGMSPETVVERHAGMAHHVYMIGFLPGYPYLGDLPEDLRLPRQEDPRQRVPPGSVGIATAFTGIYPVASPGGWWLIGRTPVPLFDLRRSPVALLAAGDTVRFEPVTADSFAGLEANFRAERFDPGSLRCGT